MTDIRYDCGMGAWTSPSVLECHFNDLHKRVEVMEERASPKVEGKGSRLIEEIARRGGVIRMGRVRHKRVEAMEGTCPETETSVLRRALDKAAIPLRSLQMLGGNVDLPDQVWQQIADGLTAIYQALYPEVES